MSFSYSPIVCCPDQRDHTLVCHSLETLPFASGSFDFVHLRFIGLGVPENAWSNLFAECKRVLRRDTGILEVSFCQQTNRVHTLSIVKTCMTE